MKTLGLIIFIIICASIASTASAENIIGFSMPETVERGEEFNVTIWIDCEDSIDGFYFKELQWTPDCVDVISIVPGWWDWLWDAGVIADSYVLKIQAGNEVKTMENQTACVITCFASESGVCTFGIEQPMLISGGPEVPCMALSSSISIEGEDDDSDDSGGSNGGGHSGGSEPADDPPVAEPDDDEFKYSNVIISGRFMFQTMNQEQEDPFVGPIQEEEKVDDEDDVNSVQLVSLWEITAVVVAVICGFVLLIVFIVKRGRHDELEK